MAIEATNKEDEQKVQQGFGVTPQAQAQQNQTQSVTPTLGGAQSSTLGQDVGQAQNQQQTSTGQASTGQKGSGMGARLSNLKQYIQANRGVSTAGKIKGNLEAQQSNLSGNITGAYSGFQQNQGLTSEKERLNKGEQLITSTEAGGRGLFEKGRTENFAGTQTQNQQPVDFVEYGQTPEERLAEFNRYKAQERQQFDIANLQDLERQQQELAKTAQNTQSEEGRYQVLREMFKRPSYTTGQQRLDQLLLQAQPEETAILKQVSENVMNPITKQMEDLKKLRDDENLAIRQQAERIAQGIETGLGGEKGARATFEKDIQDRLAAEKVKQGERFANLNAAFESGAKLSKEQLKDYTGIQNDTELENLTNTYNQTRARNVIDKILTGMTLNEADVMPIYEAKNLEEAHAMAKYRTYPWASAQDLANQLNASDPRQLVNFLSNVYQTSYIPGRTYEDVVNKTREIMNKSANLSPEAYLSTRELGIPDISTQEDFARQQALDLLQNRHSNLVQEASPVQQYNYLDAAKLGTLRDNYTESDMLNTIKGLDDSYISEDELRFRNWLRNYIANR